jgi:hypothetical protein
MRKGLLSTSFIHNGSVISKPEGWKNPLRQEVHQVFVTRTKHGDRIAFGPAMGKDEAQQLCDAIRDQIRRGFEKLIAEPNVIRVQGVRS